MNSGESLMSAVQWSGPRKGTHRKRAGLDSLLLMLALVILAIAAVVFAATPAETPAIAGSGGPAPSVGVPGGGSAFEVTIADPVSGAWNHGQAAWFACQANDLPALLCSAEASGATP